MNNKSNRTTHCKFCGQKSRNYSGYCQRCYQYFIVDQKQIYPKPKYGEITFTPEGDCICPECGMAFSKLGNHTYQKHKKTTKEAYPSYGWYVSQKASNIEYRKHMKEIQDPKTIDINLLEKGKDTRYSDENIPHQQRKPKKLPKEIHLC